MIIPAEMPAKKRVQYVAECQLIELASAFLFNIKITALKHKTEAPLIPKTKFVNVLGSAVVLAIPSPPDDSNSGSSEFAS